MYKGDHPNTNPLHRRIVDRYLPHGAESVAVFHKKWTEIVNEMIEFAPGLVIISAGFDAHKSDPLGGCDLLEADFYWATRLVMDACVEINPTKPIPCISVLEGGYNIGAITKSALIHCQALEEGYKAPAAVGDEVAALQRFMASVGLNSP
jgi:acetoin utilization deacetylase AcuC-like enzyme